VAQDHRHRHGQCGEGLKTVRLARDAGGYTVVRAARQALRSAQQRLDNPMANTTRLCGMPN